METILQIGIRTLRLERTEFLGYPTITLYGCRLDAAPYGSLEDWANCAKAIKNHEEFSCVSLSVKPFRDGFHIWNTRFPNLQFAIRSYDQQTFWDAVEEMVAVEPLPFVYGIDG